MIYLIVYVIASIFCAGAMYGDLTYGDGGSRKWLGQSWLVALIIGLGAPVSIPVVLFLTGFLEHGWISPFSWKEIKK